MSPSRGRAPSQRQLRVGEELRHALARVFSRGGFKDPALAEANITVTEVRVSPDLRSATAFVTPLGGADMKAMVAALNRAAGFVRGQLSREVDLRFTPRIGFEPDVSFDQASRVRELLNAPRVRRDLSAADEGPAGDGGGPADETGGKGHGT